MKITKYGSSLLLVFVIASCSNPLDKPFNRETAEFDFARIVKLGMIDTTEVNIMSHFMVKHDLIGAQVLELDATYRDILNESKVAAGVRTETGKAQTVDNSGLLKDLKVTLSPSPTVLQSEWSHGIKFHIVMENTSGKAIKAVKGNFVFYDAFGERVYFIEFKYLDPMEVSEKVEKDVTLRIQNTAGPQLLLEYGNSNPFVVKWEPLNILFN